MEQFSGNPLKINGINGGYKFVPADVLTADVINQIVEAVLYNLNKKRFQDIRVDSDAEIENLQCDGTANFNGTVYLTGCHLSARQLDWEVPTSALHYDWLKLNKPSEVLIYFELGNGAERYTIECAHLIKVGDRYIGAGTLYYKDLDSGDIIYTLTGRITLTIDYIIYVEGTLQSPNELYYSESYFDHYGYPDLFSAVTITAYKKGTADE